MEPNRNVLGSRLYTCSLSPLTGFKRDGTCHAEKSDQGVHGVCSELSEEFLKFTKSRGNDLSTPNELYGFPGLNSGDRWCLCASRWKEALDNGVAPPVVLNATSEAVLRYIDLEELLLHAVDG